MRKEAVVVTDNHEVLIGHPPGEHIGISVRSRLHPSATDYWDGNWLVSVVDVKVGGFLGRIDADLRAEEFVSFRQELDALSERPTGTAQFDTMEGWVQLRLAGRSGGHLDVSGTVVDRPGTGNRLHFRIDGLDQTCLPAIIASLRVIEEAFPVLGDPASPSSTASRPRD